MHLRVRDVGERKTKSKTNTEPVPTTGRARPFIFAILSGRLITRPRRPIARAPPSSYFDLDIECRRYCILPFVPPRVVSLDTEDKARCVAREFSRNKIRSCAGCNLRLAWPTEAHVARAASFLIRNVNIAARTRIRANSTELSANERSSSDTMQ